MISLDGEEWRRRGGFIYIYIYILFGFWGDIGGYGGEGGGGWRDMWRCLEGRGEGVGG